MPTLMVVEGGKEVARLVGGAESDVVIAELRKMLELHVPPSLLRSSA